MYESSLINWTLSKVFPFIPRQVFIDFFDLSLRKLGNRGKSFVKKMNVPTVSENNVFFHISTNPAASYASYFFCVLETAITRIFWDIFVMFVSLSFAMYLHIF